MKRTEYPYQYVRWRRTSISVEFSDAIRILLVFSVIKQVNIFN
jgi:pilus assembly protein TadC